jgi:AmmeMemoRadiSam system protein B
MKMRHPAVAGRFYPGTAHEIRQQLSRILEKERPGIDLSLGEKEIIGAVVPHAGYMFSAYEAIHFFEILKHSEQQFDTFFIINPNHTGYGEAICLDENDAWETPFGDVELDKEFHELLSFPESSDGHRFEHSGEVMVPLLQYSLNYPFRIVPITLSRQNPHNAALIANSIFKANEILGKRICIIASSDFSHYVDPHEGNKLDQYVINEILNMNTEGVFREVREKEISVCGFGPIMTLMEYAKLADETPRTRVLRIGHSGEVIPSSEVVDYVTVLFYRS